MESLATTPTSDDSLMTLGGQEPNMICNPVGCVKAMRCDDIIAVAATTGIDIFVDTLGLP